MPAVAFEAVDIVFGDKPQTALPLIEKGLTREQILAETGQVLGVADCTLTVERGQICVLMGLSGSGKSTLLRAVNGLNKVVRGSVKVDDQGTMIDVATCDPQALRRLRMHRVAMVFQQFALLPWRTVAENVAFGLELRGVSKAERDRTVMDKLALVHLEKWAGKFAHELSGGMQQRVGLARAFATDADILLMDEPFSALDPLIRDKLQDDLLELQQRLHKTIVFVSHDLDEALKIGNTIAIMEGGRIVQAGVPETIVTSPATDYVRNFVANVNPLNVLKLGSLMRPTAALRANGASPRARPAHPPHGHAGCGRERRVARRRRAAFAGRARHRAVRRRCGALRLDAGRGAGDADAPGDRGHAQQRLAGAGHRRRRPVARSGRHR